MELNKYPYSLEYLNSFEFMNNEMKQLILQNKSMKNLIFFFTKELLELSYSYIINIDKHNSFQFSKFNEMLKRRD